MARASKDVNSYLLPTLEGFRNKLLDLTSRNNLLNLSLASKRTARLMRFVASDPQAILNNLCSGYTLELKPLPDPPEEEEKKLEGEEFKAALVRAREQDPLYQQIHADSSDDKKFSPALAQAEDRLRSKVREEFEQRGKSSATKNLAKWAETQGINPSYDLSFSDKKPPSKNGTLQVLLLAQRLDRLAESMRKSARSSIEETGNNILYLAFGCLEWSEKNKTFYAPLILLPVELIKFSTRGGAKSYSLRGTEDAPVGNVTLKERLRRDFLIDFPLPNLTEDGGNLKAYFDQVAEAVAEVDGWAVRPNLKLALLNFSGLGLYEDLDPQIVQSSALVKKLMAAELSDNEQGSESGIVAEDVHVDQPSIAEKVPILITQADASQFASIADVMSGRSMVIEGPPGTGKSQTITNIIANALYAGKRVLFVAEKKVALDVVYTRLSEAGLKPYCLRIASDKTNKREVYDELGERLLLPRPQPPRRDAALGEFNQLRDQLNSFSQLLNQSHGAEEESHQELLWAEVKLKQELQKAGLELAEFKVDLPAATAYTRPQQPGLLLCPKAHGLQSKRTGQVVRGFRCRRRWARGLWRSLYFSSTNTLWGGGIAAGQAICPNRNHPWRAKQLDSQCSEIRSKSIDTRAVARGNLGPHTSTPTAASRPATAAAGEWLSPPPQHRPRSGGRRRLADARHGTAVAR